MNQSVVRRSRTLSERLYRLLLRAYPPAFREEYASEMLLTFRDARADARCEWGVAGVLLLWGEVLPDFARSVCSQHARHWLARARREYAFAGKERLAMAALFSLQVAQRTDIGQARTRNEDSLASLIPDDDEVAQRKGALFVVADGMGDHGDKASELVIQQVTQSYYQSRQDDVPTALRDAITQANMALRQANERRQSHDADAREMGTTCVAAVLRERSLYVANVGDSRAYVLHAGQLRQVTRDHSMVAQLVERGELTPAEARAHPRRTLIYRALGGADVEVDLFVESVEDGDTLILCTDGLCGVLEDEELRAIVARSSPEESVHHLIARANALGGPDNITAIVVRVSARS